MCRGVDPTDLEQIASAMTKWMGAAARMSRMLLPDRFFMLRAKPAGAPTKLARLLIAEWAL